MFRLIKGYILYIDTNYKEIIKNKEYRKKIFFKIKVELSDYFNNLILHLIDIFIIAPTLIVLSFFKRKTIKNKKIIFGHRFGNSTKTIMSDDYKGLIKTLEAIGQKFDIFYYDKHNSLFSKFKIILKIINEHDTILISSNNEKKPRYLTNFQLKKISKNFKKKIIYFLWDSTDKNLLKSKKNLKLNYLNVIIDNPQFKNFFNYDSENIITKFPVYDYEYLEKKFDLKYKKDIETCFIGQISSHRSNRKIFLKNISKKINIFISIKNRNSFIDDNAYYKILSRSKIMINFSKGIDSAQIKGRVFESVYNECMVLEEKNDLITNFFEPNKEIIFFENEDDCIEKILFFIKNEELRQQICIRAKNKLLKNFSSEPFWKDITF